MMKKIIVVTCFYALNFCEIPLQQNAHLNIETWLFDLKKKIGI